MSAPPVRISLSGSSALLVDGANGPFDDRVQQRFWQMERQLSTSKGVAEMALGMNNLLVVYDPFAVTAGALKATIQQLWETVEPKPIDGTVHEIPVVYGGPRGEDLGSCAEHSGLTVEEFVRQHAAAVYTVAAVGAMAGFPYLSGLAPNLARGRRAVPKAKVEKGSVIIGGTQASVMPQTAPSGWHILGFADIELFDPNASKPSLMRAGDTVRFIVAGIET